MEYTIYTDGSCDKKASKSAAAYFIRTSTKFINAEVSAFTSIFILEAELFAIIDSINFLLKNCNIGSDDKITIYIDSKYAIDFCKSVINGEATDSSNFIVYNQVMDVLYQLVNTGAKLSLRKVKAHMDEMNTNKFVDRLAKLGIKYNRVVMR